MARFHLILMPYELARLREGVGCSPERLLQAGALAALGRDVRTEVVRFRGRFTSEAVT